MPRADSRNRASPGQSAVAPVKRWSAEQESRGARSSKPQRGFGPRPSGFGRNRVAVGVGLGRIPRVGATRQPWALLRNRVAVDVAVGVALGGLPRVGATRQPWALLRNRVAVDGLLAVGAQDRRLGPSLALFSASALRWALAAQVSSEVWPWPAPNGDLSVCRLKTQGVALDWPARPLWAQLRRRQRERPQLAPALRRAAPRKTEPEPECVDLFRTISSAAQATALFLEFAPPNALRHRTDVY